MKHNRVNDNNINSLVVLFYTRVLSDKKLAPFFVEKLGDDLNNEKWKAHMQLLTKFWSTMILGSNTYNGAPFPPHAQMKDLDKEAFETWIVLFYECVEKLFIEEIAIKFKERGTIVAGNFVRRLNL